MGRIVYDTAASFELDQPQHGPHSRSRRRTLPHAFCQEQLEVDLAALQRASTVNAVFFAAVALASCQGDSSPSLVSIELAPAHPQLIQGEAQHLKATGTYSDSSHQDVTTSVVWSSLDPTTASISNSSGSQGLATATHVGTTTVSASEHGITASVTLTVVAQPRVVYVASEGAINQYTIRSDGGLVASNPATIPLPLQVFAGITVDSAGKHAYVAYGYVIAQFGIKPDGTLSALNPASIAAGVPQNGAQVGAFVIHPGGRFGYALSGGEPGAGDGGAQEFIIRDDGTLQASPVGLQGNINGFLLTPDGKYAYVFSCGDDNCDGSLTAYAVAADGSFTKLNSPGSSLAFSSVSGLGIDPGGTYVYVAALNGNQPAILQFRIAANGGLTPLVPAAIPLPTPASSTSLLSFHPSGRYLYVAINYIGSSICQFSIGDNGVLSPLSSATLEVPNRPLVMAEDPSGSFAYVLSANVASISEYSISASGALTPIGDVGTGVNPSDIVTAR